VLKLQAIGQQVDVEFDGPTVIQVTLADSPQPGGVGFRAARGILTAFQAEQLGCHVESIVKARCA
jgi:hypothetical protein